MSELLVSEETLRKMPFSMEAEQSVLGSIIIDPEKMRDIVTGLRAEDFYLEQHARIYDAMKNIFIRPDCNLDEVTLLDELVRMGEYDEAGGKSYIMMLAQSVPSVSNLNDYVRIIKEKAILRRLIEASDKISKMAFSATGDTKEILDRSEQLIFDIAEKNETKEFRHIKDVIMENYKHLEELQKSGSDAVGIKTHFSEIDKMLVGMGKGDLVIIGARPGVGKTSLALNIATNVAIRGNKTVAIFSLEMSCEQLVSRMLASEGSIDSYKMRRGDLEYKDWENLSKAAGILAETEILIDDSTGITATSMKAKLRRVKNLGLVGIDYLQLMQGE